MPDIAEDTAVPITAADEMAPTVVRPVPMASEPAARSAASSGSAGFAEEVRQLLRKRLLVTHGAIAITTGIIALLGLTGNCPLPAEAGLGVWEVRLPLLVFCVSLAGLIFLLRHADTPLPVLRLVEFCQFSTIAIAGGTARFIVLTAPPAASPDPMFHDVVYRYASVITGYPLIFAVILYSVLIPNSRRRCLTGIAVLCLVPILATALSAAVNVEVREEILEILASTMLPLFMAAVVGVFSASRLSSLQRLAFDALREAKQLGAYTLKKKLGEGGMGEVWLAEHRLLKRPCAMKFIRAELAANPDTARRFEREVRAVTSLTHYNTVRIYDYGSNDDGSFYYVMEFLAGPTLDQLVKSHGTLEPGRVVYFLRQLCGALGEAHSAGMVHRDLKPNNIIITSLGGQRDVAKLLDFGLVQDLGSTANDDRITCAGTVLGTPSYMCPEQAGGEPVDERGDIYSLGAVAFFMLAGQPPFVGNSIGKLISAHLTQPAPDLRAIRADIPNDLAAVVARCLMKKPGERFQNVSELEKSLAACACSMEWNASAAEHWWQAADSNCGNATELDPQATRLS